MSLEVEGNGCKDLWSSPTIGNQTEVGQMIGQGSGVEVKQTQCG